MPDQTRVAGLNVAKSKVDAFASRLGTGLARWFKICESRSPEGNGHTAPGEESEFGAARSNSSLAVAPLSVPGATSALLDRLRALRPQLRYGLRVTVAGVAAFVAARSLNFPLHGLWSVLTAIVVSQVSVGGSLRATIEYNVGTLGGALFAVAIGLAVPHATPASQALVLALAVGPMAVAAAMSPSFRVAPFSAVLVLLIGAELGESPILSALTRVLEVAIGGAVAVAVSLLVFPERARALGLDAASEILEKMAELLPRLLAGASRPADPKTVAPAQNALSAAVRSLDALVDETRRERIVSFAHAADPAPLARTLQRILHDFDILGRATDRPFPDPIAGRLEAPLTRFGADAAAFLAGSAAAVKLRAPAPSFAPAAAALEAYEAEIAAIRREGLSRALQTTDLERLFALGFALEQLSRNCADLGRRVEEHATRPTAR